MSSTMPRRPEPEYMDLAHETEAYAAADFAEVNGAFVERLLEVDGRVEPLLALDLGTGPGDIPLRISLARPKWRIAGLDASPAMLSLATAAARAARRRDSIVPVCGDAKSLPFQSHTFDVIFSNSILHHVSDPVPFWSELVRVGKSGASVFLRDLSRPPDEECATRIVEDYASHESRLLQEEFFRSLLAAWRPEEVSQQLHQAGLAELRVNMASDRHWDVFGKLP